MPVAKQAIDDFLARRPEQKLEVRGRDPSWLRDVIWRATGREYQPKVPWTGSDRDVRQLEALTLALIKQRALLYYAPRVGKTKVCIDWISHLVAVGWVQRALIIPHAPVGVDEWERQLPIYSDLQMAIVRSGPGSAEALAEGLGYGHGVVVTWSTLQQIFTEKRVVQRGGRKGANKLYPDHEALRIAADCFQALVVDEIHQTNDPDSLRFGMISDLAPELLDGCPWRLGLTGTPFGRDPFGLWAQARIVDGGQSLSRNYYFFQQAFGRSVYNHFSRTKQEWVFDPKKMPALQEKLSHLTLSCRLEEIQDVSVLHSTVELRMERQQEAEYRRLIGDLIAAEDQQVRNIFVRLRQVSSGHLPFIDDDGNERVADFPSAKLQWLDDFFADLGHGMQVVVFHEFVRTGARICEMLERHKIKHSRLWGGSKDRREDIAAFQERRVQVIVANHATGGTGTDLSAAEYMCVVESPVGVIGREQMLARPMARTKPMVVDDLVCSPVERKILAYYASGKSLNDEFRGGRDLAREIG